MKLEWAATISREAAAISISYSISSNGNVRKNFYHNFSLASSAVGIIDLKTARNCFFGGHHTESEILISIFCGKEVYSQYKFQSFRIYFEKVTVFKFD